MDAALLLVSTVGYKPADDPRVISTYVRTYERLGTDGLLQRYESGADGLDGDEGAFGICSFWAVEQFLATNHGYQTPAGTLVAP